MKGKTMEAVCWRGNFKLDCVELLSMKEDSWAGRGGNTATMSILKQAECEYFVLQLLSGTSFHCKCVPIIFILWVASIL